MEAFYGSVFALTPFIAWFVSGTVKFALNFIRFGREAKRHVGNGGFPSTHTSVISSITVLIGLTDGWNSALFGLSVAITFIIIIDALGVRRAVGENAKAINMLREQSEQKDEVRLREKQGHTKTEVLGGLGVGTLVAWFTYMSIN